MGDGENNEAQVSGNQWADMEDIADHLTERNKHEPSITTIKATMKGLGS